MTTDFRRDAKIIEVVILASSLIVFITSDSVVYFHWY